MRRAQRRTVEAFCAGHLKVSFVDGSHFHLRTEIAQDFENSAGVLPIALGMTVNEDRLWAEFISSTQRHGGVHAKFAGFVRSGGANPALIRPSPHHNSLALQGRIKQLFHRHKKSVHVQVENNALRGGGHREVTRLLYESRMCRNDIYRAAD